MWGTNASACRPRCATRDAQEGVGGGMGSCNRRVREVAGTEGSPLANEDNERGERAALRTRVWGKKPRRCRRLLVSIQMTAFSRPGANTSKGGGVDLIKDVHSLRCCCRGPDGQVRQTFFLFTRRSIFPAPSTPRPGRRRERRLGLFCPFRTSKRTSPHARRRPERAALPA